MRTIVVLVLAAACSKGGSSTNADRPDDCATERDRLTPIFQGKVDEAVAASEADSRADVEAQGKAEMEAFAKNFVEVCVKHDKIPLKCFEDSKATRELSECPKDEMKQVKREIYKGIQR